MFAPTGRDAALTLELLERNGFKGAACASVHSLCEMLDDGAGALLLAEEALSPQTLQQLSDCLQVQAPWSDLPVMVLATSPDQRLSSALLQRMLEVLGNVTLLERPIRVATLMTAVRAALRARKRQYTARESLQALQSKESALKQADQRKDEFLAMLAHELRNPMAAISMAMSLMERAHGNPERLEHHRATARRQMGNLVRLVDDLLDVSRITRGMVELRKSRVNLSEAVQNAVTAARPSVEERQHRLEVSVAPGAYELDADSTRLEQVIANLLSNAAKYTPPGGEISVQLTRQGDEAVLKVKDNGRGIPAAKIAGVFDLFVQVDPGLDRKTGGLGLGLTLVKRLVEMHHGAVSVQSEGEHRGSTFQVRLPLLAREVAESRSASAPAPVEPPSRRRIVLVEDSEDLRMGTRDLLMELGHDVHVAADGPEGVAAILQHHPDIALVDVGLPGISGYEVARQVRAHVPSSESMLVSLTGYGGPETLRRSQEAGFDRHLIKPLNLDELPELMASAPKH